MKKPIQILLLLLATLSPWAAQAQTKTHIASTSSDTQMTWDEFATSVNNGTTYWRKTVYLDEDVTATTMAGNQDHAFGGTFEGNGKTITLSGGEFGTSSSYASQEGVSPFYWIVNNARIKNLHIAGNIYSSNKHAAGFCYGTEGECTIYNCRSSVTIYSTAETEAGCGFVAQPYWNYTNVVITIEGCVFDGAIIGSGSQCGGFVNYPNKAVNIKNCLFAPSDMTIGASGSYMFHQINNSATVALTNCYYSTPWGATAQGKKAYTITCQSPATVAMNGTATNYNVSHITAYSGTQGLVYNGTIIAGAGDQVSLNLESNYDYFYAVDHGTLTGTTNPYTLTMDAYNTTITGFSSVPYADDFESPCDWQFLNGDRINQWCYGTAASNGTGTHGLYISNDGGTTNAYTDVGTAYASGLGDTYLTTVYAAKMLHFEEGAYNITFDWRALGYLDYDYMRVALVPASVSLEAGAYLPAGFSNNTLPEGWLALDGGQKLNQSAEWQTHSSEFWVPASGNYKVVFAWRNSVWDGNQPPAAIDNVSVTAITCSTPFNLVATNINATVADLNWNGSPDVDSYTLMYRTAEDIGAQFKEDFESEVSFANWQAFGSSNTGNNFGRRTAAARTGSYGFSFSSRFQAAQYSQYLISPELSATGDLEFYFRASENNSREIFEIGYSSTGNNVDDFVWGQRYVSSYNSYWRHFQETIPEGTKYIAIHYTAQYQYELYIDDLTIGAYEVQAGEWQTTTVEGGSMNMEATLSGLTPETLYETYVYPDCNPDKQSEVSKFKTREICPVPTNLTVGNYTPNSADLSWTAVIEVENYTVKYRTISNGEWQTLSVAGNAAEASITLTGLTQGTTYEAQVKSDCSDPEKWSETVWFTVPILCDVPTALSATPMLESATLTWEGDQEGYNVQCRPVTQGQAEWIERQVTETTLDITGLDSGTTYEWRVQGINLVCENGVTDWSETVRFTTQFLLTKEIVGYGEGNANWYLMASPLAGETSPSAVDNMLGNTYDLYHFNPFHEGEEWENYENGNFSLVNGQGYLYANREDVTLTFSGVPIAASGAVEVPLTYDAYDDHKCWNLVGNPFNCNAYLNKDYYILNNEGTGIDPIAVSSSTPIPPCTAVFVKATSADDKVVLVPQYVDLGLPSGLLWATCNVGADTPEAYGDYFAWGETQTNTTNNWSTYQYCNGSYNTLTKYCSKSSYGYNGFTDDLTTLLPEDDAATANWGSGWRMPTQAEWQELYNNTTSTWITQNGVNGRLFTASNGASLFLPAAGRRNNTIPNSNGYYWSSSLCTDSPLCAWYFGFDSGYPYMDNNATRVAGFSVRPVRDN